MSKSINWTDCRRFMLDYSKRTRQPIYVHNRVSRTDIEPLLHAAIRKEMRRIVDAQPSLKSKTIMSP